MSNKDYWVSPTGNGRWSVKREGADRAANVFDTQAQANARVAVEVLTDRCNHPGARSDLDQAWRLLGEVHADADDGVRKEHLDAMAQRAALVDHVSDSQFGHFPVGLDSEGRTDVLLESFVGQHCSVRRLPPARGVLSLRRGRALRLPDPPKKTPAEEAVRQPLHTP